MVHPVTKTDSHLQMTYVFHVFLVNKHTENIKANNELIPLTVIRSDVACLFNLHFLSIHHQNNISESQRCTVVPSFP